MAIQTEYWGTRKDGVDLYISYSDIGYRIAFDGETYDTAIDPMDNIRAYTETDIPRGVPAETEDYINALRQLGVTV